MHQAWGWVWATAKATVKATVKATDLELVLQSAWGLELPMASGSVKDLVMVKALVWGLVLAWPLFLREQSKLYYSAIHQQ